MLTTCNFCEDRSGACTGGGEVGVPILNLPGWKSTYTTGATLRINILFLESCITSPGLYASYNVILIAEGKLTNCKTMGVGRVAMGRVQGGGGEDGE